MPVSALLAAEETNVWWSNQAWAVFIFALIGIVGMVIVQRGKNERVPRGAFRYVEHVYTFVENMALSVIGPHGKKYVPLLATLFCFILVSNLIGVIGFPAPTASLNTNLGLSISVFLYVQYEGIRANGFLGYLKHFWGPVAFIGPLMFFIEVVSEFAKIISLSLRLYGNMYGEHQITHTLANMVKVGGYPMPVHAPLVLLAIFTCLVQALVFTMLTAIYLSLMTSHEHDEGHHEVAHAH